MAGVTLLELKAFLNIAGASSDDELTLYLAAATAVVENELPAPVATGTVTETVPVATVMLLRRSPVSSVLSVAVSGRTAPLVVGTDVLVDQDAGLLTLQRTAYGIAAGAVVTVTYNWGWATLPEAVRLAVYVVAGHLWETQRGTAALPMPGVDTTPVMAPAAGYALPNRALELLAPYRRGPRV